MARTLKTVPHVQRHKDGTVWAKGQMLEGEMHGYWEWFRKDGVRMRSGSFEHGVQTGEWTTYDKQGRVYKVTQMKAAEVSKPVAKKSAVAKPSAAKLVPAKSAKAEPSADALIADLDPPLKADIAVVRAVILAVDPSISDGVKWNSLSFRTDEWFCTVNLRAKDQVQLVLHFGAKIRKVGRPIIPDPTGLLDWKSDDRALASLGAGKALRANAPALKAIVRAWIKAV